MRLVAFVQRFRERRWPGYALAIVLSLFALWLRIGEPGPLAQSFPFLSFFGAVALAGFFGGLGPGLVAVVLSAGLADYFLVAPIRSFSFGGPDGILVMAFVGVSLLIVTLMHNMFRAYQDQFESKSALQLLNAELEKRVRERTDALAAETEERAAAQAQVRQMQKIETLGQLTGGIAHDFNNMLAIVIGSLDLTKRRLSGTENPKIAQGIDHALEGASRAAGLTARLLAFARRQALEPAAIDINRVIAGMSEMLNRTLGEPIRVVLIQGAGLWPAFADRGALENALLNLAINARDAMPEGGTLRIETANRDIDVAPSEAHPEIKPGQYVAISIADTGIGMSAQTRERVFEPFFTTKDSGRGSGLGLSQVYGYVTQTGGFIEIDSALGAGTVVALYLPRHEGDLSAVPPPPVPQAIPRGSSAQVILVVEDEAAVRQMTSEALRELGYTVIEAENGPKALEEITAAPRVDLVFTDIVMPEMNGRKLAEQVHARFPGTPVLFTSGYMRDVPVPEAGLAFLKKPFTIEQLAIRISDLLA